MKWGCSTPEEELCCGHDTVERFTDMGAQSMAGAASGCIRLLLLTGAPRLPRAEAARGIFMSRTRAAAAAPNENGAGAPKDGGGFFVSHAAEPSLGDLGNVEFKRCGDRRREIEFKCFRDRRGRESE